MPAIKTLCFYHPTTVVIVDDNKTFLENLPDNLSNATSYKLFDSPVEALAFLEAQRPNLPTPDDFLGMTDDPVTGVSLNVNIPKIHALLQKNDRFKTPAVVIVDHDMPGMSGLEFCRNLKDFPIRKIMLTGEVDHRLAVQAFNDGIIHRFIVKDDPKVFEVIDQAIHELQQEHFLSLSGQIAKNITTTTFSFIGDENFQQFFEKFIKENNIVEFYLIDPIGSFLLVNNKGELIRLVVQSDQEIENYRQTAEDHKAAKDIIEAIASKEKLLCLFAEEDFNQSVNSWSAYLYPAHKIEEIDGGYYAMVHMG
ncbi:MAG: Response regulator receiver [Gammaproteobacteria bacterium]|jgi:CheY-like chemotaxis protein|nr:Response regulator receiver [Gammaproteobacteria bacterium]